MIILRNKLTVKDLVYIRFIRNKLTTFIVILVISMVFILFTLANTLKNSITVIETE